MRFAPNLQLTAMPVDAIQVELGNLASPQSETNEQLQDGEVPAPRGAIAVAEGQQICRLVGVDRPGKPGQVPSRGRRHSRAEQHRCEPFQLQEPKERSHPGHGRRRRAWRAASALVGHKRGHRSRRQD